MLQDTAIVSFIHYGHAIAYLFLIRDDLEGSNRGHSRSCHFHRGCFLRKKQIALVY